jgi:hypothetical protein
VATYYAAGCSLSYRVVTNSGAAVVSRHDYKPFGEEISAGAGGRTTGMGFPGASDGLRQKFTGYERDSETMLDFAQARFYKSTYGRGVNGGRHDRGGTKARRAIAACNPLATAASTSAAERRFLGATNSYWCYNRIIFLLHCNLF